MKAKPRSAERRERCERSQGELEGRSPSNVTALDDDPEVDHILDAVRSTWKAGIARDETVARAASERRLARDVPPQGRVHRVEWVTDALPMALCVAICVLGGVVLRHAGSAKEAGGIQAEAPTVREDNEVTSAGASAPPSTVPSTSASAIAVAKSAEPALRSAALPPLPPPARSEVPRARRGASNLGRIDRRALHLAHVEMTRGDMAAARDRLRLLTIHGDSALAFDASLALARSFNDPREELIVWDQALRLPLQEPYLSRANEERTRVLGRLAVPSIVPAVPDVRSPHRVPQPPRAPRHVKSF